MPKEVAEKVLSKGDDAIEGVVTKPGKIVNKMAKSQTGKNIGGWAFMIGFVIALIVGVVAGLNAMNVSTFSIGPDVASLMLAVLVVMGLIVGLVNISSGEVVTFLVSAVAIAVTPGAFSALNTLGMGAISAFLGGLTGSIAAFVAPAAVIVALKSIYSTARDA